MHQFLQIVRNPPMLLLWLFSPVLTNANTLQTSISWRPSNYRLRLLTLVLRALQVLQLKRALFRGGSWPSPWRSPSHTGL